MTECMKGDPLVQVKVNDTLAKSVRLRFCPGVAGHLDVVVEDRWLGAFTLHRGFDLLLKEECSDWRPVGLDELRSILAAHRRRADFEIKAGSGHGAGYVPQEPPNDIAGNRPTAPRVGEVTGLDASLQRIEAVLYRAAIPHCRAGLVFIIPSMLDARKVLRDFGLCQHAQYESVLVDPESGVAIRLMERDPDALQE